MAPHPLLSPRSKPTGRPCNTTTPLGRYLVSNNLSSRVLSEVTGINVRTLSDYVAGRKIPTPRHLALLCEALDVEPDALEAR